jgi:anti-sigma factor (TIGR02949 family)
MVLCWGGIVMADQVPLEAGRAAIPEECLAVVRHLWDLLDDQLTDAQAARLRSHIAECEICHRYQLYQETFLEVLASYRDRFGAPSAVKAKVLESLREAGFTPASAPRN